MHRLLPAPTLSLEARTLGTPDPAMDAAARAELERAVAQAYARGLQDGSAAATTAAEQAAARLIAALERTDAELRALAGRADVALARQIATAVLGREPEDASLVLLERVEAALAALDDERIAVHVNCDDAAALGPGLRRAAAALGASVELVEDPAVPAGEAILAGRWARADLTRAGAWGAVSALLEGAADA